MASEGFPIPYKPNSKCVWYITVSITGPPLGHAPLWVEVKTGLLKTNNVLTTSVSQPASLANTQQPLLKLADQPTTDTTEGAQLTDARTSRPRRSATLTLTLATGRFLVGPR